MIAKGSLGRGAARVGRLGVGKLVLTTTAVLATGIAAAACGSSGTAASSSSTAGSATASGSPVTIAFVCSCSGLAGSEFHGAPGAFTARIDAQNAAGGVNGHKIKTLVIDDQTSPSLDATAVQNAVSKGVLGIVADSVLFFAGAKYANQAGIPVTGAAVDGPEWGTQPYTNMFASDFGSLNPTYPANTALGKFLVAHGGTVLASYGYGISPSSVRSAVQEAASMKHAGGKVGVLDTSVPLGSVAFTPEALAAKSNHINALYAGMYNSSNFALATAMKQAGVKLKAVVFPTGYQYSVVKSPAWQTVQGDYFTSLFRPFQLPNAGTKQMQAALIKYDHFTKSQFPNINEYESWLGADLMIKGMQAAGSHLTPQAVVKALRGIKSYTGNGLLPNTIDYATIFGHDLPQACGWYMQAKTNGFVPSSTAPFCGTDIPGSGTVKAG